MSRKRVPPCRFCGGRAVVEEGGNALWPSHNVVCTKCGASTGTRRSAESAIEAWSASPSKSCPSADQDPAFSPLFVSDGAVSEKPARKVKKGRKDLPGQLMFSFMEA